MVIRITIWILPLMAVEHVLTNTLNALHKDAAQAWASLWGSVHILIAFWLVWQFGMVGACWAMVLRPVVRLAVIMPCAIRTLRPYWREYRGHGAPVPVESAAKLL
jgi:Na+-driven multidrug efflux pump